MGLRSLVPPQAAGRIAAVRSVRHAKNKERTRRSLFFGGPKAEYFAGGGFGFRWACVRSCRRKRRGELWQFVLSGAQKIKSAQGAPYFLVDLRRIELRSYKVPPRILHA